MEGSFAENLSKFVNKFITIYVRGGPKFGFSGFVLDVNINCVTLLSINNFNTWTTKNIEEIFIQKTIIIIPIDKITAVVSYTNMNNTSIPTQGDFQNENYPPTTPHKTLSMPLIIGLLAFLILKGTGGQVPHPPALTHKTYF